jgi:hypothetical protein
MSYKIIGHDGKTYGPTNAEQIHAWIAQGRIESRTPVFVDGAADWTFVGLLPEFAGKFSGAPQTISPLKSGATQPLKTNACALWSLICGILSWMTCCCCCIPFNVVGLILGIVALVQLSSRPENEEGRTLAIVGLVLSAASLLLGIGWAIISLATDPSKFQMNFNSN